MNITIAMLTYNRKDLFIKSLVSLKQTIEPYELIVIDNGSNDGTSDIVSKLRNGVVNKTNNNTIGYGFLLAMERAMEKNPDVVLFTADDYIYCENWLAYFKMFWQSAPEDTALCTLSVEPIYIWNTILDVMTLGPLVAIQRKTVPGANWSFRASLWPTIKPTIPDDSHLYDYQVCNMMRMKKKKMFAVPLAEHVGAAHRTWTTEEKKLYART